MFCLLQYALTALHCLQLRSSKALRFDGGSLPSFSQSCTYKITIVLNRIGAVFDIHILHEAQHPCFGRLLLVFFVRFVDSLASAKATVAIATVITAIRAWGRDHVKKRKGFNGEVNRKSNFIPPY